MADTLFQYPGGKSGQFARIKNVMPQHTCWVEGFGGSGVMTLNKQPAEVDVYNDLDSELVHFFLVYREAPERLVEWIEKVPYSYETYEDFVDAFYGEANEEREEYKMPGEPLTDNLVTSYDISQNHIRRAGIFFTLRYMQFGAKYQGRSGFGRSKVQNGAQTFKNAAKRLNKFAGVWDHVTVENTDYSKLVEIYDGEETLFYFDPPYIGTEEHYRESDFSHKRFCETVTDIKGYFIISYDSVPKMLSDYYITREQSTNFIDSGISGEGKDTVESLIMNFDPAEVQKFTTSGQVGIEELSEQSTDDETGNAEDESSGIKIFED